jgi:hypothetical protein
MPANPHPNAHPLSGRYTNAPVIAADIVGILPRAVRKSISLTRHHAMLLETRVKAKVSGRPGPRARTGDYRGSWTSETTYNGMTAYGTVGTNKPQGRRLEHGFVGEDRLGRTFNQPPFPHLGPAVEEILPGYERDMANVASWGGSR